MDRHFKQFLKDLCTSQSRSLVGKLCKRIELLEKDNSLTSNQKLNILKTFCKELVYENFRDVKNSAVFYTEGREYNKLPIYTPKKNNTNS